MHLIKLTVLKLHHKHKYFHFSNNCVLQLLKSTFQVFLMVVNLSFTPHNNAEIVDPGDGTFIKAIMTKGNKIFCAWENDDGFFLKT